MDENNNVLRTNADYVITKAVSVEGGEVVLGELKTPHGEQYVTWRCDQGKYYYWGHYFANPHEAEKDMYQRAISIIESKHPELARKSTERSER